MSKPEFVYVTYIETTAEKLWQALTDGDFTERYWFGVRLRSDWKVGSSFEMVRGDGSVSDAGKVVEYDPPRRLAYTFVNLSDKYNNEVPALATFELEPYGKLVKLTLTHRRLRRKAASFCSTDLQGMARYPVQPQEHAGNRPAARDPLRRVQSSKVEDVDEYRRIQAGHRLHHLHRLHAGEGVAGADVGGFAGQYFFGYAVEID